MIVLRSALFNLLFFGLTAALGLYGIGLRLFARHRVIGLAVAWARLVLTLADRICGIRFTVLGREHLPDGAALIASQHQSAFDTLVWLTLVPHATYVLKQELTRVPLFGPLLRPGGQIVVDRGGGAAALRGLLRDGSLAAQAGRQIVIFPEGTRATFGTASPLQPGVAALARHIDLPVVPVATDSGLHWGRRAFRKRPGTITVALGPPLPADLPRAAMLDAIRNAWSAADLGKTVDKCVGDYLG